MGKSFTKIEKQEKQIEVFKQKQSVYFNDEVQINVITNGNEKY